MADMQIARRVWQHLDNVIFRPVALVGRAIGRLAIPALLPFALDRPEVVGHEEHRTRWAARRATLCGASRRRDGAACLQESFRSRRWPGWPRLRFGARSRRAAIEPVATSRPSPYHGDRPRVAPSGERDRRLRGRRSETAGPLPPASGRPRCAGGRSCGRLPSYSRRRRRQPRAARRRRRRGLRSGARRVARTRRTRIDRGGATIAPPLASVDSTPPVPPSSQRFPESGAPSPARSSSCARASATSPRSTSCSTSPG